MTATASAPPLILIAAIPEHSLASVFQGRHFAVVQVHTATLAAEWVRDVRPDTIIIDAELPDMSGIDACRLLHSDPRIGHTVRSEERRVGKGWRSERAESESKHE